MKVNVLLFAAAREAAGANGLALELAAGATVADAAAELGKRLPRLAARLSACSFAVDLEVTSGNRVLREGCELAVLPPVSGG